MAAKKIKLDLTRAEAVELFHVSLNGWADGDYYEDGKAGRGTNTQKNSYLRAYKKLTDALEIGDLARLL